MKQIRDFFRCFFNAPITDILLHLALMLTFVSVFVIYTTAAYTCCSITPHALGKMFVVFGWNLINILYILLVKNILSLF